LSISRSSRATPFEGGWDALVTDQPGVMVTVRTADCVPVLLYDPERRVVAAIHAGWRGAVAGIVPKTVALMVSRFGATADRLQMAIGPSAGPCCYEVDEPVLARLREVFPEWQSVVKPVSSQKAHLDLRAFVRRQALVDGLAPERVATVDACTICQPERFYSYRRDGVVKATMVSGIASCPTGRCEPGSAAGSRSDAVRMACHEWHGVTENMEPSCKAAG
jgi:YfiH family protein